MEFYSVLPLIERIELPRFRMVHNNQMKVLLLEITKPTFKCAKSNTLILQPQSSEIKTQSSSGSREHVEIRISKLPPWLPLLCMVIYIKEEYPRRSACRQP